MKTLFLAIQARLQTIVVNQEPLFKHFDIWNQNVEFLELETPFRTPACFIEFDLGEWQQELNALQSAPLSITLHIVTEHFARTADSDPKQSDALEYLNYPQWVYDALAGWETSQTNGLTRTRSIVNHNHERYIDSREVFQCQIFAGKSTSNENTITKPPIDIKLNP